MLSPDPDDADGADPTGATLVQLMRREVLTTAQRRTVLIGVALEVAAAHARREVVGPVHPRAVWVPPSGRPQLTRGWAPSGWSTDDDVVSIRRLARALTGDAAAGSSVAELLRRLTSAGEVAALPVLTPPEPSAPRRRWWGRAR